MSHPFMAAFERIGTEALAVRVLELSMLTQAAKAPMSDADRAEWQSIIAERREYLASKIDDAMAEIGLTALETLESLRVDRARRAKR